MKLTRNETTMSYRYGRPLPDGTYDAVVLGAIEDISHNGNHMIVISVGVEGPHGGVRVDHHVVAYLSGRVEELLQALAPEQLHEWYEYGECELDPEQLVDQRCRVQVNNESWNGRPRPRIRALIPAILPRA